MKRFTGDMDFYKGSLWATTPTARRKIDIDFTILRHGSRRATSFPKEVIKIHRFPYDVDFYKRVVVGNDPYGIQVG